MFKIYSNTRNLGIGQHVFYFNNTCEDNSGILEGFTRTGLAKIRLNKNNKIVYIAPDRLTLLPPPKSEEQIEIEAENNLKQ